MMKRVLDELAALPGVRSVGATQRLPLRGPGWTMGLRLPNAPADAPSPRFRIVTGNYFATLGIPVRARTRVLDAPMSPTDSIASIVVNEALVKIYFPDGRSDRPGRCPAASASRSASWASSVTSPKPRSRNRCCPRATISASKSRSFPRRSPSSCKAARADDAERVAGRSAAHHRARRAERGGQE